VGKIRDKNGIAIQKFTGRYGVQRGYDGSAGDLCCVLMAGNPYLQRGGELKFVGEGRR